MYFIFFYMQMISKSIWSNYFKLLNIDTTKLFIPTQLTF